MGQHHDVGYFTESQHYDVAQGGAWVGLYCVRDFKKGIELS